MTSAQPVIMAQGLSKRYRLGETTAPSYGRLTEAITDRFRRSTQGNTEEWLWALDGVSFELLQGEVLGIVGRNGAGKSTLLKILARITTPTRGRALVRGRLGSLLEVGTGFHPELTGRENIFLNGAILGMRRREVERKFDEIIEFAELRRFIDTPVKRYSSGMYVRLAFAVAAHLEPDVLVVDEVLAVGDIAFQRKCLGKMGDVAGGGRTVLFVSHNISAVRGLCTRAILLERGQIVADGAVESVTSQYLELTRSRTAEDLAERRDRKGSGDLRVTSIELATPDGRQAMFGNDAELTIEYVTRDRGVRNVHVSVAFFDELGGGAVYLSNELTGDWFEQLPTRGRLICRIEHLPLLPGSYSVNVFVRTAGEIADWVTDAASIHVAAGDFFGTGGVPPDGYGSVTLPHRWDVEADVEVRRE